MKLSDFDYNLPPELIAQQPANPHDSSRLMVLNKREKTIQHSQFLNLVDFLNENDVLVFNDSKVFPARLIGQKDTGGKLEVFLLKKQDTTHKRQIKSKLQISNNAFFGDKWEVLVGGRRKQAGQEIIFSDKLKCQLIERLDEQVWLAKFNLSGEEFDRAVDEAGEVPTPPYIKIQETRYKKQKLVEDYQTVYAKNRGSAAAPTAGFHFTDRIFKSLEAKNIKTEFITLHVGLGTFAPVKTADITQHQIHSEFAVIEPEVAERLNQYKMAGRRIIAVGTTSARTLEAFAVLQDKKAKVHQPKADQPLAEDTNKLKVSNFKVTPGRHWVDIYIYPGYEFKFIDGMITNFHLPKSTLIMLISALAGREFILKVYQEAIKEKYRFYSFGDSMLIL